MDSVVSLYAFADVLRSICNDDVIMLANLTRVCKAFHNNIGSCQNLLEGLAAADYFNAGNIIEILNTYGNPSQRLREIYCSNLPAIFETVPNHQAHKDGFKLLFTVLAAPNGQTVNLIENLNLCDCMSVADTLWSVNCIYPVFRLGININSLRVPLLRRINVLKRV